MRAIQDLSKVVQRLQAARLAKIEAESLVRHWELMSILPPSLNTLIPGGVTPVYYSSGAK